MGATRIGLEQACSELGIVSECVFTSEIKPYAVSIYSHNFNGEEVYGDITTIDEHSLPKFDLLLGGFPCQAFSSAGKKAGFNDTRGTLFFDVIKILKAKQPKFLILENVEGLVKHDPFSEGGEIGKTLTTILSVLTELGYDVSWKVLNSKNFGVPQARKRIFITGCLNGFVNLEKFPISFSSFGEIKENGLKPIVNEFTEKLLELFDPEDLHGKSIKDKRGGSNNIHSWDLELKGKLNQDQKNLMSVLLKERRKKKWAELKGIDWMDGMSLTLDEIHSFNIMHSRSYIKQNLDDLVEKKYLSFEHPKKKEMINGRQVRVPATHLEKGYNIVAGKLSFFMNKILSDEGIAPTIVATETDRIGVIDKNKIRRLSQRECLRLFGFPESYEVNIETSELYDLIGNSIVVPVMKAVALRVLKANTKIKKNQKTKEKKLEKFQLQFC